jgi:hypothetical protein
MKICVPLVVLAILIPGFISCSGDDKKTEPLKGITCLPEALRSHVLAFYPLGQTLSDFSGNENHLTAVGTFTHAVDRDGNENCAIEFDNLPEAGSYLTMADPQFLNGLEEFSISLWYSPEDPTREGGIYERLISRGDDFDCDGNGAWSVGLYDCRRPVFSATSSLWDEQVTLYCETEITARTGVWQHIVATYKVSTKEMTLYCDGVLRGSTTDNNCQNPMEEIGDLFLAVGYTGKLDDVILFDKVLEASEVSTLIASSGCCTEEPH